jgi:flavin reductase (DIM6/NTAB) family NADH-FMN oxidoreductase RutF
MECLVKSIIEAGDHAIFIGEAISVEAHGGQPLLYFNRDYRTLT